MAVAFLSAERSKDPNKQVQGQGGPAARFPPSRARSQQAAPPAALPAHPANRLLHLSTAAPPRNAPCRLWLTCGFVLTSPLPPSCAPGWCVHRERRQHHPQHRLQRLPPGLLRQRPALVQAVAVRQHPGHQVPLRERQQHAAATADQQANMLPGRAGAARGDDWLWQLWQHALCPHPGPYVWAECLRPWCTAVCCRWCMRRRTPCSTRTRHM